MNIGMGQNKYFTHEKFRKEEEVLHLNFANIFAKVNVLLKQRRMLHYLRFKEFGTFLNSTNAQN